MADNSIIPVSRYEATILWDAQERIVLVHCLDGDPLIGMSLLRGSLTSIEVVPGGNVTIAQL